MYQFLFDTRGNGQANENHQLTIVPPLLYNPAMYKIHSVHLKTGTTYRKHWIIHTTNNHAFFLNHTHFVLLECFKLTKCYNNNLVTLDMSQTLQST